MKVAFCNLPLKSGHKTRGIGFYVQNLLSSLHKLGIEIQEFGNIAEIKNADVTHYPFFDLFTRTLPLLKKFPTIVTIHDVTPLLFPEQYPPGIKGSVSHLVQRLALRSVEAVITDSESSKQDLIKKLNVPEKKIFPIYLAPAAHFHKIEDNKILNLTHTKYNLPENYALFTGSVNWNKNLLNLCQASLDAELDLVLVGKDFENAFDLEHPERKSYKEFIEKFSKNPKIHILGFVSDEDLVAILNMARVALLPSYYEGFGLPILEAQICGVPVITSDISSMPEVAGDGAILVDPHKTTDIETAIKKIMYDTGFVDELIKKGFENVKKFSWKKTALETFNVYEKVFAGKLV